MSKEFTTVSKHKQYDTCPNCESENIDWGNYERDYESCWFKNACMDCDFEWNEVYKFTHNEKVGND